LHPQALRIALELEALAAPANVGLALHWLAHLGRAVGFEPGARVAPERVERDVGRWCIECHRGLLVFPEQGRISNPTRYLFGSFWPIRVPATIPRTRKHHKETTAMVLLLPRVRARR
jgi:hypothetical protein